MSRELRTRLESAQRQVKTLREQLQSMNAATPLPEDLETIERLTAEIATLEPEQAKVTERLAREREERAELEREVLRREPRTTLAQRGATLALVMGVPVGLSVMAWWFDQQWGRLPIAAVIPFVLSAWWLLRGAWRAGRASGARGPG